MYNEKYTTQNFLQNSSSFFRQHSQNNGKPFYIFDNQKIRLLVFSDREILSYIDRIEEMGYHTAALFTYNFC